MNLKRRDAVSAYLPGSTQLSLVRSFSPCVQGDPCRSLGFGCKTCNQNHVSVLDGFGLKFTALKFTASGRSSSSSSSSSSELSGLSDRSSRHTDWPINPRIVKTAPPARDRRDCGASGRTAEHCRGAGQAVGSRGSRTYTTLHLVIVYTSRFAVSTLCWKKI